MPGCPECSSGVCRRREVEMHKHLRIMCHRDRRYALKFDKTHGVVDESVVPESYGDNPPKAVKKKSKGLGDVVAKTLRALGVRKKKGCGCSKRQSTLNQLVPFKD